jgi:eukaryotic-like serine/threonine-protein kinase
MFKFITHRGFLVNLLVVLLLGVAILFGILYSLESFTAHNETKKIPSVVGKKIEDAKKMLNDAGFDVEILDSTYVDTFPKNSVLKQSPDAGALVKANRTVFLSLNRSQPPVVVFPNMVGYSLRNALMVLNSLGLKVGDTSTRVPDIAPGSIKQQLFNGKTLEPGTKIFMGSTIDFVIGGGLGEKEMLVPDLIGMTYAEVNALLTSKSINLGNPVAFGKIVDTANAYVVKQDPTQTSDIGPEGEAQTNRIRAGQIMTVWISQQKVARSKVDSALGISEDNIDISGEKKNNDQKKDKQK